MAEASSTVVTLASLAQKLSHELLEVRERALHSLAFKLDNSLLRVTDVGSSEAALRALLEWFNFEETGAREVEVLAMLRRIANEDPTSVARLLKLGADRFLRDLCANGCVVLITANRRRPQRISIPNPRNDNDNIGIFCFFSNLHFRRHSAQSSLHTHKAARTSTERPTLPTLLTRPLHALVQQRQTPLGDHRGAD